MRALLRPVLDAALRDVEVRRFVVGASSCQRIEHVWRADYIESCLRVILCVSLDGRSKILKSDVTVRADQI